MVRRSVKTKCFWFSVTDGFRHVCNSRKRAHNEPFFRWNAPLRHTLYKTKVYDKNFELIIAEQMRLFSTALIEICKKRWNLSFSRNNSEALLCLKNNLFRWCPHSATSGVDKDAANTTYSCHFVMKSYFDWKHYCQKSTSPQTAVFPIQ